MIAVWIEDPSEKETKYLCICIKDAVGLLSDETLTFSRCVTAEELQALIDSGQKVDMACIDVGAQGALPAAEHFRSCHQSAYLVLIAGTNLSPVRYMRPSIRAEGLILKPFQKTQVRETVREAVTYVLRRFAEPDEKRYFVVDNADGRELIEYGSIYFFESRDKKIYLNTGAKEYAFYDTLDRLEGALAEQFIRCHRSFLVNRSRIQRVQLAQNQLLLTDDYAIPVSRTYKSVLREYGKAHPGERRSGKDE